MPSKTKCVAPRATRGKRGRTNAGAASAIYRFCGSAGKQVKRNDWAACASCVPVTPTERFATRTDMRRSSVQPRHPGLWACAACSAATGRTHARLADEYTMRISWPRRNPAFPKKAGFLAIAKCSRTCERVLSHSGRTSSTRSIPAMCIADRAALVSLGCRLFSISRSSPSNSQRLR